MASLFTSKISTPLGEIAIRGDADFIHEISFEDEPIITSSKSPDVIINCIAQLEAYFTGKRKQFELPLRPAGTLFQSAVWQALLQIPYAATASYMDLAKKMGNEKSVRAVGAANGKNPIAIIIPCHRVIGSNNSLVGYAGGLWRKQWLLEHEAQYGLGVMKLF